MPFCIGTVKESLALELHNGTNDMQAGFRSRKWENKLTAGYKKNLCNCGCLMARPGAVGTSRRRFKVSDGFCGRRVNWNFASRRVNAIKSAQSHLDNQNCLPTLYDFIEFE